MSDPLEPAPKPPRDRTLSGRRQARERRAERERRIVDCIKQGLKVSEIAAREGVSERGMRKAIDALLARRGPEATVEFVFVQVNRLNEALRKSYDAMSPENLPAVDRVVRIVRELDRPPRQAANGTKGRRKPLKSLKSGHEMAPASNAPPRLSGDSRERGDGRQRVERSIASSASAIDFGPADVDPQAVEAHAVEPALRRGA